MNGEPWVAFEIRTLIRLQNFMKERNMTPDEMFNSCDVGQDNKIEISELTKFIMGVSPDFKQKEAYALMVFLDLDNNGTLDKGEFVK